MALDLPAGYRRAARSSARRLPAWLVVYLALSVTLGRSGLEPLDIDLGPTGTLLGFALYARPWMLALAVGQSFMGLFCNM